MKCQERMFMLMVVCAIATLLYYRGRLKSNGTPLVDTEEADVSKEKRNTFGLRSADDHSKWLTMHPWDVWKEMVKSRKITDRSELFVNMILKAMSKTKILKADVGFKGTQLKTQLILDGPESQSVVFKPKSTMKCQERMFMLMVVCAIATLLYYRGRLKSNGTPLVDTEEADVSKEKRNTFGLRSADDHSKWLTMHPWDVWKEMVKSRKITDRSELFVNMILKAMSKTKILKADVGFKGTQLKTQLILDGPESQSVVFKPKRYERDRVLGGTPYEGYDRHNAEIAAFHLDRVLGFNRAPPAVGRIINLNTEILPVCKTKLRRTFFNDGSNICFYGVCMYCKKEEPACGKGENMEGSLTLWIPVKWKVAKMRHPWQRTYRNKKARWEVDMNYCESVVQKVPYKKGPRLLDIMDTSIFDFIIGNADRHHYEYLEAGGNDGMLLHMDNGKSFGNPHVDEMSILAPLYQCCRLRESTYARLKTFSTDSSNDRSSLSAVLSELLRSDPIYPILTKPHLEAIDRRLTKALDVLKTCFEKKGRENVLFQDSF